MLSALEFQKKFGDHWTPEVFIHASGNEIGIIDHFWPSTVHHVKMNPSKEIDLLLSVKHEISRSPNCMPDSTLSQFVNCFKSKIENQGGFLQNFLARLLTYKNRVKLSCIGFFNS